MSAILIEVQVPSFSDYTFGEAAAFELARTICFPLAGSVGTRFDYPVAFDHPTRFNASLARPSDSILSLSARWGWN